MSIERRFGYHVSTNGGLFTAIEEAKALTCNAIQIFLGPPHTWRVGSYNADDIKRFKEGKRRLDLKPVVAHAAYLPNPASADKKLWEISVHYLIQLIRRAHQVGVDAVDLHLGSNPSRRGGLEKTAQALKRIERELPPDVWVLLETDAGPGNHVGNTFEELGDLLAAVQRHRQFAVTLDTCHIFAAGYDIRTSLKVEEVIKQFERSIGFDKLYLIHANDSKGGLGSHLDRHEHIGDGQIGLEGFRALLNHPRLKEVPFVLETPQSGDTDDDLRDIKTLRKLAR